MIRALVFGLVLALAACGKKDDAPPAPTPPAADQLVKEAEKARAESERLKVEAEAAAHKAVEEAKTAEQNVAQVEKDLEDLNAKVGAAVEEVAKATSDAERQAGKVKLEDLKKQRDELAAKMEAAKAEAAKAVRAKGVTVSKECLDNPLAKGCQ